MSTHPYIPLYVDDYDAATSHLSIEEDGAYSRLIRLCWRTPGCSLPTDPAWIARKIRVSAEVFDRVVQPVLAEFFKVQRGRLVQKRLKAEYDSISRSKTARKLAGKKGGEAKARKTKENAPSIANDLPAHAGASPYPYPEPEREEGANAPLVVRGDFPKDAFAVWYGGYPHKVGRAAAEKAFDAIRKGRLATFAEMTDGRDRYIREKPPDRSWCNPATWLNQHRWLDEPQSTTGGPTNGQRPHDSRTSRNIDAALAGFELFAHAGRPGDRDPGVDPEPRYVGGGKAGAARS